MPYEIVSPFYGCADMPDHDVHYRLEDASACFEEIKRANNGNIRIHPISGKYIHAIIAVDKDGDQRDFTKHEKKLVKRLGLDPKSVYMETPSITTFYNLAKMYTEALRLIPMLSIDLEGLFEHQDTKRHFWNTDAGIGQAILYTQQALYTLELSLKALLEVYGKIAEYVSENKRDWRTHDLAYIFNLLPEKGKEQLERNWRSRPASTRHFDGTFSDFLTGIGDSYTDWRYIPELKSSNLTMEIRDLLAASDIVIDVASFTLQGRSPIKVTFSEHKIIRNGDTETPARHEVVVKGIVVSVKVPESFDPHSEVEVVINSEHHEHDITALFYKRDVESYYQLTGERVLIVGYASDAEPNLLEGPDLVNRETQTLTQHPIYKSEHRTLKGSVYNVTTSVKAYQHPISILTLQDETYFTKVDCHFSTDEERNRLAGLQLGDAIFISGFVTLQNGRPLILVGPDSIEKIEEEPSE